MTDKEKIKNEIKRLQSLTKNENDNFDSSYQAGKYYALLDLEDFIDSLPKEPVIEDLEE